MPVLPPPPEPESRIGPYRLIRPISAGGMARVYEGRLDSLAGVSTRVAIKVIHPDFADEVGFQELFINEARVSARLEHQNLVRIQQFNREDDLYYLVMEFIDGITLRKVISLCRKHGVQVPVSLVAEVGRQVCEGLHYAHMATTEDGAPLQLVHRDIKPSNLMLNGQGTLKLLDFGISYASGAEEARGSVKGTWGYMAMEQADGEAVGPAADVFGLGAVLYELAALEPLFDEKDNAVVRQLLAADEAARRAAALGGAYADLAAVLVRALQRDPEARYKSAAAMGGALARLVVDPITAHDGLVRLFGELRQMEGNAAAATGREKVRSVSTMTRAQSKPGALPIHSGGSHGPAILPNPTRKRSGGWRRIVQPLVALAMLGVSVLVLVFAVWRLVVSRPDPARVEPVTPPAAVALVPKTPEVVAPVPTPVAAVPKAAPKVAPVKTPVREPETPRITPPAPAPLPAPAPAPAPVVEASPETSPETKKADGLVTLSSMPKAQVMIDGQYVRFTPLFQYPVSAGMHTVLLVTDDGRRKTFRIDVQPGRETRRIWLFDEERWSEP